MLDNLFPRSSNRVVLMAPNIQCPSPVHQYAASDLTIQFALDMGFLFKLGSFGERSALLLDSSIPRPLLFNWPYRNSSVSSSMARALSSCRSWAISSDCNIFLTWVRSEMFFQMDLDLSGQKTVGHFGKNNGRRGALIDPARGHLGHPGHADFHSATIGQIDDMRLQLVGFLHSGRGLPDRDVPCSVRGGRWHLQLVALL